MRNKKNAGFTMAEMLIVVAILMVLFGLTFISVMNHQRSSTQLEYDTIAREILIAAQNHLTMVKSQGYGGMDNSDFGTPGSYSGDAEKSIYYITYPSNDVPAMFDLMLPFGSIDETIRAGGSYIIRYQPSSATVLDVFYSYPGSSSMLTAKGHKLGDDPFDYYNLMEVRGEGEKSTRMDYHGAVVGWYGNLEGIPTGERLRAPSFRVINAEVLKVEVTDTNFENSKSSRLKLIIEGKSSKAKKSYLLRKEDSTNPNNIMTNEDGVRIWYDSSNYSYTILLDDVTRAPAYHFSGITSENANSFIPGEDLTIKVVAYNNTKLSNIAGADEEQSKTTNSLFADHVLDEHGNVKPACIRNIRHLENLSYDISGFSSKTVSLTILEAKQEVNLDWVDFCYQIIKQSNHSGYSSYDLVQVYSIAGKGSGAGSFFPINQSASGGTSPIPTYVYDGQGHSISNVTVSADGNVITDAGLFGNTASLSEIKNLELIDFSITGTTSAGALAGSLSNCIVTNVLARNGTNAADTNISASGNAGGLIGELKSGTVRYCAAAVIVDGRTAVAGGLIGTASGTVTSCYSGGHTTNGAYNGASYDVKGATAGGLIGNASSAEISNSYSTCSVSGTPTAGGFVGNAGGKIVGCYCTGLVWPSLNNNSIIDNAFYGSGSPGEGSGGNYIYEIINEVKLEDGSIKYKGDPSDSVLALDASAVSYNSFVGSDSTWDSTIAYDATLVKYYGGKYPLRTVLQLPVPADGSKSKSTSDYFVNTHYGDWPAPEIFIINSK